MNGIAQYSSRVGEQLGGLRLDRLIGEGGMGAVYEAHHVLFGKRHAVKLLHPELACDPKMYARFHREAQIASVLKSEHIVPVRKFANAADGTPYLVMDLLEGRDLAYILARESPLRVSRVSGLLLQACRGLRVAHEHRPGVIHRDLKPENLFVCSRNGGRELLKILDFGIAKLLEPQSGDSLTGTGNVIGTPHYMSPEQAEGKKEIDQRTDIYALGAILYEALSGQKAHPGKWYNEIISHILLKKPIPLEQHRADLPVELLAIVRRAMETDPSKRYPSIAQLADALISFQLRHTAQTQARVVVSPTVRTLQDLASHTLVSEPDVAARNASACNPPGSGGRQTTWTQRRDAVRFFPTAPRDSLWNRTLTAALLLSSAGVLAFWQPWIKKTPATRALVSNTPTPGSSVEVLSAPVEQPNVATAASAGERLGAGSVRSRQAAADTRRPPVGVIAKQNVSPETQSDFPGGNRAEDIELHPPPAPPIDTDL